MARGIFFAVFLAKSGEKLNFFGGKDQKSKKCSENYEILLYVCTLISRTGFFLKDYYNLLMNSVMYYLLR